MIRYLKTYHDLGILQTEQGDNLREECKKIKGVTKMISSVSGFRSMSDVCTYSSPYSQVHSDLCSCSMCSLGKESSAVAMTTLNISIEFLFPSRSISVRSVPFIFINDI